MIYSINVNPNIRLMTYKFIVPALSSLNFIMAHFKASWTSFWCLGISSSHLFILNYQLWKTALPFFPWISSIALPILTLSLLKEETDSNFTILFSTSFPKSNPQLVGNLPLKYTFIHLFLFTAVTMVQITISFPCFLFVCLFDVFKVTHWGMGWTSLSVLWLWTLLVTDIYFSKTQWTREQEEVLWLGCVSHMLLEHLPSVPRGTPTGLPARHCLDRSGTSPMPPAPLCSTTPTSSCS